MNIEGNKVLWKENKFAVTESRRGYDVYAQWENNNGDVTSFRYWSVQESFDNETDAIEYAKELKRKAK